MSLAIDPELPFDVLNDQARKSGFPDLEGLLRSFGNNAISELQAELGFARVPQSVEELLDGVANDASPYRRGIADNIRAYEALLKRYYDVSLIREGSRFPEGNRR